MEIAIFQGFHSIGMIEELNHMSHVLCNLMSFSLFEIFNMRSLVDYLKGTPVSSRGSTAGLSKTDNCS